MRAPCVLVCGHVTLDRLAGGVFPGGSAYYVARALVALGARVRVLTAAAADFPRDALAGVEARIVPSPVTTAFANDYAPDGTRTQRVAAAAPPLDPSRLPDGWRSADLLCLVPVLGELEVAPFTAHVAAPFVGLCVQGLVRALSPGGAVRAKPLATGPGALARVAAAVVGDDEARGDPALPARLAAAVPVVAWTHGARGCDVLAGGGTRRVGVHPAREVDPTGAGDVFAAAFFLALGRGDDPAEAARLGAAAASIAVEGRAGEALGRVAEAPARAARVPVERP